MCREYSKDEELEAYMESVKAIVRYWSGLSDVSVKDRCEGVAFSILTMMDGCSGLPAVNLSFDPHPDDKEYRQEIGENFFNQEGRVFNDNVMMHELFYKK